MSSSAFFSQKQTRGQQPVAPASASARTTVTPQSISPRGVFFDQAKGQEQALSSPVTSGQHPTHSLSQQPRSFCGGRIYEQRVNDLDFFSPFPSLASFSGRANCTLNLRPHSSSHYDSNPNENQKKASLSLSLPLFGTNDEKASPSFSLSANAQRRFSWVAFE